MLNQKISFRSIFLVGQTLALLCVFFAHADTVAIPLVKGLPYKLQTEYSWRTTTGSSWIELYGSKNGTVHARIMYQPFAADADQSPGPAEVREESGVLEDFVYLDKKISYKTSTGKMVVCAKKVFFGDRFELTVGSTIKESVKVCITPTVTSNHFSVTTRAEKTCEKFDYTLEINF